LSWNGGWKSFTASLDGQPVGFVPDQKSLKAGQEFSLSDGSTLKVQLAQELYAVELRVPWNGRPLPGSPSDPAVRLRGAAGVIFFVAGLNIVLGFLGAITHSPFLLSLGLSFGSVFFGAIFLLLGYLVRRRSVPALAIAFGLFALDGILSIGIASQQTGHPVIGGIVARIFFLTRIWQGFGAIRSLKEDEATGDAYAGA